MPPPDTHPGPDSPDRVSETRPKTPERTRRRNRLETLLRFPNRSGMPRQGDPVRNRTGTASTKGRLSAAVPPGSDFFPGSVSPVRARIPSVSTVPSAFIAPLAHVIVACRAAVPAVVGAENGIKPGDSQDDCQRALVSNKAINYLQALKLDPQTIHMPLAREHLLPSWLVVTQYWTKPRQLNSATGLASLQEALFLSGFRVSARPCCSTKFKPSLRRMAL